MADLQDLVDELMFLNDDNLAQRVIDDNDVRRCLSELYDILSADVAPVVHGHWVWDTGDIYRCTACNEKAHVKEVMERPYWPYCPNCGAKMDETDE